MSHTTLIPAACGDHLLELDSGPDGDLWVTVWEPASAKRWGRFHWAWEVLRGRAYGSSEFALGIDEVSQVEAALVRHIARFYQEGEQ